jgi:hypothetical protein
MGVSDIWKMQESLAIEALLIRYVAAIDARDWRSLNDCLLPDAILIVHGDAAVGARAATEMVKRSVTRLDHCQHFLTNCTVQFEAGGARVTSYLLAQYVCHDSGDREKILLLGGIYHDEVVRRAKNWRFARRELEVTWSEG